jgi:hypothetical protein
LLLLRCIDVSAAAKATCVKSALHVVLQKHVFFKKLSLDNLVPFWRLDPLGKPLSESEQYEGFNYIINKSNRVFSDARSHSELPNAIPEVLLSSE